MPTMPPRQTYQTVSAMAGNVPYGTATTTASDLSMMKRRHHVRIARD